MPDSKPKEVHVEGTQFYRRGAIADVLRIVLISCVTLVAISILIFWAVIDSGAREAHKEARDIRRALRIVGTEYYGNLNSIYDPHSPNGLIEGAAEEIAEISTRNGEVILYSWDEETHTPIQFEYRKGLYRVIYTDCGEGEDYSAGVEGNFVVYYSFEILNFEAE